MTKKTILLIVCILVTIGSHAQETEIDSTKIEGWKKSGHTSLMINQTAFSNWVSGGENSVAATLSVNYNINYLSLIHI